MSKPRLSGWIVVDRPGEREYRTTKDDSKESLKALVEHLERTKPRSSVVTTDAIPASEEATNAEVAPPATTAPLPSPPSHLSANDKARAERQAKFLSEVVEEWHAFQVSRKRWKTPSTWTGTYQPALRVFRELVSKTQREVVEANGTSRRAIWDIPVGEITIDSITKYVNAMWVFPASQGKRPDDKDARQLLGSKLPPQSTANAFKKIERVTAFLRWAARKEYVDAALVREITLPLEDRVDDDDDEAGGYVAFGVDHLSKIFDSPAYRDDIVDAAWKYWLPLIGIYTAARIREISDLTVDDFVAEGTIECLSINDNIVYEGPKKRQSLQRKRLKSPSARRIIPLHPKLLELGLLDFVKKRKEAGASWLFDDLLWEDKSGYGRYPSQWFRDYTKSVGVYEKRRLVYHSFRATLSQMLENANLEGGLIDRFLGHAATTIRGKHYGRKTKTEKAFPVNVVLERLRTVDVGAAMHRSSKWS